MKLLTKEHILTLHKALIEEYGGTPELRDEGLLFLLDPAHTASMPIRQ